MRSIALVALLSGATACRDYAETPTLEQGNAALSAACSLSIREIYPVERVASRPFIRPEHVAGLSAAPKYYPEELALLVTLTTEGERRMLSHTRLNVGGRLAMFCGETEVSRATISEPFGNNFRVNLPDKGGT